MLKIWREEAAKEGIDLYITRFESFGQAGKEYLSSDIDAAIDFQPVSAMMSNYKKKANHKLLQYINSVFFRNRFLKIVNYQKYVNYYIKHWHLPNYKQYPCLTPGWDNTSRRKKNAFLFINNSPSYYAKWLDFIMKHFKPYSQHENFILSMRGMNGQKAIILNLTENGEINFLKRQRRLFRITNNICSSIQFHFSLL